MEQYFFCQIVSISGPNNDCRSMFTRVMHLLMCLIVLACPATGGACCGVTDGSFAAIDSCEHQCCCDCEGEKAPAVPDCPEPCHDCFCAGALPPGFNSGDELQSPSQIAAVDLIEDLGDAVNTQRLEFAFRDESPPHGRTLLTFYCRLLL